MVKPCPSCGTATVPEARFCRLCGAPLHVGTNSHGTDAPISPLAQTIPLAGEGRATDGLNPDEVHRNASDTSRVGRVEMENLLRRAARTPTSQTGDDDAGKSAQQTTTLVAEQSAPAPDSKLEPVMTPAEAVSQPPTNVRARRMWQILAVVLLCVALVAGALAFILSRRASSTDAAGSSPISISDQKQLVSEKLAEAEVLVASGEFNRAVTVLRAAVKLDGSSAEAHLRLGNALEKTGARTEAIDEYRAATESDPNNSVAWRALASAQVEEKLYNDAADSYRRLIDRTGENGVDDETRLAYADALRLAGRTDEARAAYQKISAAAPEPVAQAARRHLAELGPGIASANTERPRDGGETRAGQPATTPMIATAQTPAPTPLPSATPSAAGNSAQADADSYYFKALNIVNGRSPASLSDGELTAALNYFLRAQGGTHSAEARRNADRLGREYDRRRKR